MSTNAVFWEVSKKENAKKGITAGCSFVIFLKDDRTYWLKRLIPSDQVDIKVMGS